ncbi:hypothetical protein ABL840_26735 [Variovorax sp. NFACC27]|uniref:hypothetical protein n=1 Tax=unclassified Variovorax TaxID=663243 RepID=UPI00089CDF38|nr:hypothetical protein SAMN03159371_03702 [Variovorax sp. NFACC28]SEG78153.1 hypothetical protein SAMN03159365_03781 [Variovorax sp. NFACC29]SFC95766.1 hypothetical protein SAMN03159379_03642 [Variovorax sp. NFACC26]SFG08915.1 hypothetical protein SAMN03159447_01750 [Variovorax sp. NFACC27]
MTSKTAGVPVKYIGREDPFYDRLYGSNLSFVPGQTRTIPDLDLVAKFLRHSDCFERDVVAPVAPVSAPAPAPAPAPVPPSGETGTLGGESTGAEGGSSGEGGSTSDGQSPVAPTGDSKPEGESAEEPADDTEDRLAEANKTEADRQRADQNRLDLVQTLDSMDKDALQDWGMEKFSQKVPKNLSVENMRARIVEMIDQYGVP